jgi:hypothetical protein
MNRPPSFSKLEVHDVGGFKRAAPLDEVFRVVDVLADPVCCP